MSSNGGTLQFQNIRPPVLERYVPRTTGQAIMSKKIVEFLPDTQQDLSFTAGARTLRFNIADASSLLCGAESYLEFTLSYRVEHLALAASQAFLQPRLEPGGLHALWDKIEVKSNMTGNTLWIQEYYNKWYAQQTRTLLGPHTVAQKYAGDGIVKNIGSKTYAVGKTHAAVNTIIRDPDDAAYGVTSAPLEQDGTFTLLPSYSYNGEQGTSTVNVVFRMKILSSLLLSNIPLMLMKNGIQIILTLAPAGQAIMLNPYAAAGTNYLKLYPAFNAALNTNSRILNDELGITIRNPKYCCMMLLPNEQYTAELAAAYRTENGIMLNIPSCRVFRVKQQNTTKQYFNIQPGVRSVKRITVGTYNSIQLDDIECAFTYLNISQYPVNWWKTYQFRIGAVDYPNRKVDGAADTVDHRSVAFNHYCELLDAYQVNDSQWSWGAYRANQPYSDGIGNIYDDDFPFVYDITDIAGANANARVKAAWAPRFPIATDFRRDNSFIGSELNGQDMSVTNCEFRGEWVTEEPVSSDANDIIKGNWYHLFFVEHDAWLKLSSKSLILLN